MERNNYFKFILISLMIIVIGGCTKDYSDYYSDYDSYDYYDYDDIYLYDTYPELRHDNAYRLRNNTRHSIYNRKYQYRNRQYQSRRTHPRINCNQPGYRCKTIKENESWESLYPNKEKRKIIKAINRTNTPLKAGKTIQVPEYNYSTDNKDFSPLPSQDYR